MNVPDNEGKLQLLPGGVACPADVRLPAIPALVEVIEYYQKENAELRRQVTDLIYQRGYVRYKGEDEDG